MKIQLYILFFSILLFLSISKTIAQPVADSTWLPSAGETFYNYRTTFPDSFDKSFTGANVTWDFSNLKVSNTPDDTFNFVLPANLNVNCYYPNVNLVKGNSYSHQCYWKDNSGFYFVGEMIPKTNDTLKLIDKYTKPNPLLSIPFYYNNTFTDTYALRYPSGLDSPIYRVGTVQHNYDGYGTLQLPEGADFQNVIRVKITSLIKDSSYYDFIQGQAPRYHGREEYEWRSQNIHIPLLKLSYVYILSKRDNHTFDTTFTNYFAYYYHGSGAGFSIKKNNEINIKAYTISEGIKIESSEAKDQKFRLTLYNMQGKLLLQKDIIVSDSYLIPLSRMATGKYILQVYNTEGASKSFSLFLR